MEKALKEIRKLVLHSKQDNKEDFIGKQLCFNYAGRQNRTLTMKNTTKACWTCQKVLLLKDFF